MKNLDPDQCVASTQKELDVEITVTINGKQQTVLKTNAKVEVLAMLLGLKWRTVQKRRQRGSNWGDALDPKLKRSSDVRNCW